MPWWHHHPEVVSEVELTHPEVARHADRPVLVQPGRGDELRLRLVDHVMPPVPRHPTNADLAGPGRPRGRASGVGHRRSSGLPQVNGVTLAHIPNLCAM